MFKCVILSVLPCVHAHFACAHKQILYCHHLEFLMYQTWENYFSFDLQHVFQVSIIIISIKHNINDNERGEIDQGHKASG